MQNQEYYSDLAWGMVTPSSILYQETDKLVRSDLGELFQKGMLQRDPSDPTWDVYSELDLANTLFTFRMSQILIQPLASQP